MQDNSSLSSSELSADAVRDYLLKHPDFFLAHGDILEQLQFPVQEHGQEKILDFRSHAISKLQNSITQERKKIEDLVVSVRDNASVQAQAQSAIMSLLRARNLEEILQIIAQDIPALFDADVVRLAMESDAPELYETSLHDVDYSGIIFVPFGTSNVLLGSHTHFASQDISLEDELTGEAVEYIFTESSWLVRSCVILPIHLSHSNHDALLAFGSRNVARFQMNQGVESYRFLTQVLQERLDACLRDTGIEPII